MADLALASPVARQSRLLAGLKRGGARLWIGAALVAVLVLAALLAPAIAPHDPLEQDLMSAQLPPAWMVGGDPAYLLGTDSLGRCVLSRLIYSARTAVAVALIAATLAALIGVALGLFAGNSPSTARPSMDFPAPDSPTSPRTSPGCSARLTPRSTLAAPIATFRPSTASVAVMIVAPDRARDASHRRAG